MQNRRQHSDGREYGNKRKTGAELACVAARHLCAEFGKLAGIFRRAGVVRLDAAVFRREAEGQRNIERLQLLHLEIEPLLRAGPEAVGPTQASAQIPDTQVA